MNDVDEEPSVVHKCVVRLSTSVWNDGRGVYVKKSLTYLKRKCSGYNVLKEDVSNLDIDSVLMKVINLYESLDGVYEVVVCNETKDWETGYVEDWDYKLVPYK